MTPTPTAASQPAPALPRLPVRTPRFDSLTPHAVAALARAFWSAPPEDRPGLVLNILLQLQPGDEVYMPRHVRLRPGIGSCPGYVPTPEQIVAACRAIRREWSDREYIKRARGLDLALMVEHFASLARSDERRETRYRREQDADGLRARMD